jgi:hypothetical protein
MTLAALFLFSVFSNLLPPFLGHAALQSASAGSTSTAETQVQQTSTSTNSQASSQASTTPAPSAPKSAPAKPQTGKKKPANQGCNASPEPASGAQASQPANQPSSDPSAETGAASAAKPTPEKTCPPAKIIVRKGGTTEPRIQLAGGPTAAEAARKRDAVNQLLGATNQNLKKTAGWQLSSSQRDTVTQTRQFVEQSKAAMADGDLERARTLAWKAELLSEDLVNPQK